MLNQCDKYCQFKSCDWYLHRVHNTENIKAFLKHMFKSLQTPLYEQTNLNFVFNRFGPMVRTWCMRYEAKHRYFKRLASFMGNFTNVPYTLAARHQN